MFLLGNLMLALAFLVDSVLWVAWLILIARVLISWVSPDPYNPIVRFLYNATEPVLFRVRRTVPSVFGGVDLSALYLLLAITFLQIFLVQSLQDMGHRLRVQPPATRGVAF